MTDESLKGLIEQAFEDRASLSPATAPADLRDAVEAVLDGLEAGSLRVAEPDASEDSGWRVNQWLKKAVLLYFRLSHLSTSFMFAFTYSS